MNGQNTGQRLAGKFYSGKIEVLRLIELFGHILRLFNIGESKYLRVLSIFRETVVWMSVHLMRDCQNTPLTTYRREQDVFHRSAARILPDDWNHWHLLVVIVLSAT